MSEIRSGDFILSFLSSGGNRDGGSSVGLDRNQAEQSGSEASVREIGTSAEKSECREERERESETLSRR